MRPMEAILFDWDGTLVDTLGALYRANVAVMDAFGLPFDDDLYRRHFAPDWRLMYRRLGIPDHRLDEANEHWLAAYDDGVSSVLFEGAAEAVGRLAGAGRRLGLVTAGDRAVVEPQLERLDLARHFEVTVYGDDLAVHKPDPAPLRRALEGLGLGDRPAEATYVGDVPDDMRMARRVGAHGVGIVSALSDAPSLTAAGADEIASSVAEWVDRALGIMRVDRTPRAPAV
jgi:HAD superfamily hydrolase (TIGR01549 family)